jgi:hypothetical protein
VVPEHETAVPQVTFVGCCWQAPVPLQAPVLPQTPLFGQRACGSRVPEPTLAQVPMPFTLHAWQVGQLADPQQTLSVQLPLTHWLPAVQAVPPARLGTQLPPEQKLPLAQSLSLLQLDLHMLLLLQTYAPHPIVAVWLQVPVPEQNEGGWWVVPVQDSASPHAVEVERCSHAPATHSPVLPQTPFAAQFGGSVVPLGTLAHVPTPLTLHDWQAAQLAVVQQTPSVQLPLPHSFVVLHAAPFAFLATQLPGVVVLPVQ